MTGYMAYSLCLGIPPDTDSLDAIDPTAIAAMRDRFSASHTQLQHVHFSTVQLSSSRTFLNVVVNGPLAAVQAARADILRQNPVEVQCVFGNGLYFLYANSVSMYQTRLVIKSFNPDCIHAPGKRQVLIAGLDDIASHTQCKFLVQDISEPEIILSGSLDAAESARVRILVFLDQMMGLRTDTLQIPYYLHNLISGRKHINIQSILEETNTNIYLQSPFTKLGDSQHMAIPVADRSGTIHLTGDSAGISRAQEMLKKLTTQKAKSMYHKQSTMHPRKLDWIMLHQQNQLRKIMRDNGSFIAFPALGSGSNTITVYAENRINVERTLRSLNYLIYKVYEVSFCIKQSGDGSQRAEDPLHLFGSPEALTQLLQRISQASGAELSYRTETGRFEAFGTEQAVHTAYQILSGIPVLKMHHTLSVFAVELAADQREFLSGKKNGKVNKIMKTCGVRIKFLAFNEYNFVITVESDDPDKALEGLRMLQDELPAEMSFFVPEIYHRRIIGVAGKNIQRVMKRFGVYVKFSGAEEFTSLGGYFENEHNVVARTPMKNQANLENLKAAVMDFVTFEKDRDFTTSIVRIPSYQQRTILHDYGSEIREACRTHNTRVWWPERSGTDQVAVLGPASQISAVLQLLNTMIEREAHFLIPLTEELRQLFTDKAKELDSLARHLSKDLKMQIRLPDLDSSNSNLQALSTTHVQWKSTTPTVRDIRVIRLQYKQEHGKNVSTAKDKLYQFFKQHSVPCDMATTDTSLISPTSDDSCLNIDQDTLAAIPSPNDNTKQPTSQGSNNSTTTNAGEYNLFNGPLPLPAFDGSSWSIFPAEEKKNSKLGESNLSLKDGPLRAIFENMPSSPPHPMDRRRASAAVLSTPMPGKNIWASPRLQASNSCSPRSRQGLMQDSATRRYHAPPMPYTSFSATTSNRPNFHQSMPDIFFGHDLFPVSGAAAATSSSAAAAAMYGSGDQFVPVTTTPPGNDRMFVPVSTSHSTGSTGNNHHWMRHHQQQRQQLPTPPPSMSTHHHHHLHHPKLDENVSDGNALLLRS
ncbi:hypothetical protein LRAMOSA03505 [Lichtheimia ramosa]|uniref:K Homology domain-containing protein n=1 Tax=Lichtheimia ramosa TaxID=688394 RepID=A0A077WWQ0_9FUNG|nr:hypothetical protein LRAMOSA03505 [Lichtheimia ramosa]